MPYRIHSLLVGVMVFKGVREPVHAWLIEGEGRKILVDAGMPDIQTTETRWKTETELGGGEVLLSQLQQNGASADDIDFLVLTHLHFDHAWNLDLFPKSIAVVQRSEVIHAIDPVPTHRTHYAREINAALVGRRKPSQLAIIEGDQQLVPGIRLMHLPGHTPGIMGVLVDTEKGVVGLPSDAGEWYSTWYPADPVANASPINYLRGSFLPPPIYTESVNTSINGMTRFAAEFDIVIPSHDWRIPKHVPEQWWAIPTAEAEPVNAKN